jgi:ABC-type dipeptide/oligopeptide/nickel transport system permease subunit
VARSTASRQPAIVALPDVPARLSPPADAAARARWRVRRPSFKLALALVVGLGLLAGTVAPSRIAPQDPIEQSLVNRLRPPMWMERGDGSRPLGTDGLGRDVLSRVIHGARTTFLVALAATVIGGALGAGFGLIAGYRGGTFDGIVRKLVDMQLAFPYLLVAISVLAVAGRRLPVLVLVLAISSWPTFARIVRGETLSLRQRPFIETARALGASDLRIALVHVLPGLIPSLCVVLSFDLARIIVLESSLSFLGLGVQPPTPSWGMDLSESRQFVQIAWWTVLFPGLAISLVVLAANLFGDWVRDAIDPVVSRSARRRAAGARGT